MSTIETLDNVVGANLSTSAHSTRFTTNYIERVIDFADALTEKGSALAANDVIECIRVPSHSVILGAGFEVLTPAVGPSTLTYDLGVTSIDADRFVDGFNGASGVAGDYAQSPATGNQVVIGATSDTVDLLLATLSGGSDLTAGTLRVWAVFGDVKPQRSPGLAALKS